MTADWKNKILAYLHDPPDKAYDFGPKHQERANTYCNCILGQGEWQKHEPDWEAAAADRFIFPDGKKVNQAGLESLGEGVQFRHPFSSHLLESSCFPRPDQAGDWISDVLPNFDESNLDPAFTLFALWRCWLPFAAQHATGKAQNAAYLPYLPADTRAPDSTIWHHNAVVSALEGTRGADGKLHSAFFLFQLGPVQDFIAQAVSTRDLWSGSYLLSWLMAHAIQAVTDQLGPDAIIFPSLRGQPLFDWLHKEHLKKAKYPGSKSLWEDLALEKSQNLVLTPNLPNRFLALVPEDFKPDDVEEALKEEWKLIADTCRGLLDTKAHPFTGDQHALWNFQVDHFWQPTWQLWPWHDAERTLELLKTLPAGNVAPLEAVKAAAAAIPAEHQDERCFPVKPLIPGWAWSGLYQLLSHRLDARRQTREFKAWQSGETVSGRIKDALSGREEAVTDEKWYEAANKDHEIAHLFRHEHALGAVNLVKRVWHKAYLPKRGLNRAKSSFDSVPAVAAAPWVKILKTKLAETRVFESFKKFADKVEACKPVLDFDLPSSDLLQTQHFDQWLAQVDASVFQPSEWDKWAGQHADTSLAASITEVKNTLRDLRQAAGLEQPSRYYAVLALDGDEMGKWLSGDKAPAVEKVLTRKAAAYFRKHVPGSESWLQTHRPVSPSYHLQFSEALANFGLYAVRRIVEYHCGQLIYAGGDDVLAMLPADEALACAQGLRLAFRGDKALAKNYPEDFTEAPAGFIWLKNPKNAEPSWPLLVPGPEATVSVGVAIVHVKEPLQDMVREAQEAEKRAKRDPAKGGFGRNALAATLFKRSGEQVQWGAQFDSPAFALLAFLREHYRNPLNDPHRDMPVPARFPYRVAELLRPYGEQTPMTPEIMAIVDKELEWAIGQMKKCPDSLRGDFRNLCGNYSEVLTRERRPVGDMISLFALEAFVSRQGE